MSSTTTEAGNLMDKKVFTQIVGQIEAALNEWQEILEVLPKQLEDALLTLKQGLEKQVEQLEQENKNLKEKLADERSMHSVSLEKLHKLELICSQLAEVFNQVPVESSKLLDFSNHQSFSSDDHSSEKIGKRGLVIKLVIKQNNGHDLKAWNDLSEEFIEGGIKTRKALLYQIRKYDLRESCELAKAKHHKALITELVIKQNNGLVAKTWDKHSEEFIEWEIKTKHDLHYRIRSNGLSKECKSARFTYYQEMITPQMLEKYRNNFVRIAKELFAPRTEVCAFGKELLSKQ